MYTIHATKKLLDRVQQPVEAPVAEPSTLLGSWYATALFWKPQVALLVNERTLVPVLLPLAPAGQLAKRVPDQVGRVLVGLGMPIEFVFQEVAAMSEATYAKTANRSTVGMLNEFGFLADVHRAHGDDLVALSVRLAGTPCGPLYKSHSFPDLELAAFVAERFGT